MDAKKKFEVPYEDWAECLKCEAFDKLQVLDFENMPDEEYKKYESSIKAYRDIKNSIDTAWRQGVEEGIAEAKHQEKVELAILMLESGIEVDKIIQCVDLSKEEVEQLKK